MLQDSGRSRVIACHSREIGNILLHYYHLENINGGKEKRWLGRDMVWVLVGIRGCVAVDAGHGLVTLLSLPVSVKDRSLHKASWASHRFIIPSTYLGMAAGKTHCSLVVYPKHILLVPGVQAWRVLLGYPAGGIDLWITGKSGTACLRFSAIVRTERW